MAAWLIRSSPGWRASRRWSPPGSLVWTAVRRRAPRRTPANWRGGGRRDDLPPEQVALLLAVHPAKSLAILLRGPEAAGRIAIAPDRSFRIGPGAAGTRGPAEERLLRDAGPGGALTAAVALAAVEALWRELDEGMAGHSGPATVAYDRTLLDEIWREAEGRPELPEGVERWLARADPLDVRERMGAGAGRDRLRGLFCDVEALRNGVLTPSVLSEAAARAESGGPAFRKDLVVTETPGVAQHP